MLKNKSRTNPTSNNVDLFCCVWARINRESQSDIIRFVFWKGQALISMNPDLLRYLFDFLLTFQQHIRTTLGLISWVWARIDRGNHSEMCFCICWTGQT